MKKQKRALVVEGGAMRGIFAAGVLDSFLDHHYFDFDFCMGVSAGSTNLAGYLAAQRGRSYKVITDYSCRRDFINLWKYLRGGHYLDLDWLWEMSDREYPLNREACIERGIPLMVVTTDADTGDAVYLQPTKNNLSEVLLASCALPMVYRTLPKIGNCTYADGGVADSVPVMEAYRQGAREITVILSRPPGFRMKKKKLPFMINILLKKFPELAKATITRHIHYNKSMDFLENPPVDCTIKLLAPTKEFAVNRTTTDHTKLQAGYEMGLKIGATFVSQRQDTENQSTTMHLNSESIKAQ